MPQGIENYQKARCNRIQDNRQGQRAWNTDNRIDWLYYPDVQDTVFLTKNPQYL